MTKLSMSWMISIMLILMVIIPLAHGFDMGKDGAIRREIQDRASEGQSSLGYSEARKQLFGSIHLKKDKMGYFVNDVYCHHQYRNNDVGPGHVPDHRNLNVEHTWPQSRFNKGQPRDWQKSDLHHLFPSDTKANSERGNHIFAEVKGRRPTKNCQSSAIGLVSGRMAFMPPQEHRGNVARALFYFAIRYNLNITDIEEFYLRQWHLLDPVDSAELERNDKIEKVQGNRNPFIDNPELASSIRDF